MEDSLKIQPLDHNVPQSSGQQFDSTEPETDPVSEHLVISQWLTLTELIIYCEVLRYTIHTMTKTLLREVASCRITITTSQ